MFISKSTDLKFFQPKKLTTTEIEDLYIPCYLEKFINSITEIDGRYYFYKEVDHMLLINELIGSYLSKLISLEAVDYQIGIYEKKLYVLSQIFYDSNHLYNNCYDFFGTIANRQLTEFESLISRIYLRQDKMLDLIDNPSMILNILKLSLIDIKMGQIDRHNQNLMLKIDKVTGLVDLAPIFDFGFSYSDNPLYPDFLFYDNPFIILRKNKISLNSLCKKYPDIINSIYLLGNLEIRSVLDQIQREKNIILTENEKVYYEDKDRKYTKVLKRII